MNKFLRNFLRFGYEIFGVLCGWSPFRLFTRRVSSLINFSREVCVRVRGHEMHSATLDRLVALYLWKFGILEPYEMRLVEDLVKEGMVVLDIGANLGFYTLEMAKKVGPRGKVIAFEPSALNYSLLGKNIKINGYHNVTCISKAVADKTGQGQLFIFEEHQGGHRIYDSHDGRSPINIETVALDDFFSKGQHIDFIKIDIEGAECFALRGMKRIIQENSGLILICEFVPSLLTQSGCSPEEFFELIIDLGLRIQLINEYKECLEPISHHELIKMCPGERNVNLYMTR